MDCQGLSAVSTSWSAEAPSVLVAVVVNRAGQLTGSGIAPSGRPRAPAAIRSVVSSWLKRVTSRVLHPVSPVSSATRPSARPTSIRNSRGRATVRRARRGGRSGVRPASARGCRPRRRRGAPVTTPCGWRARRGLPSSASGQKRTHLASARRSRRTGRRCRRRSRCWARRSVAPASSDDGRRAPRRQRRGDASDRRRPRPRHAPRAPGVAALLLVHAHIQPDARRQDRFHGFPVSRRSSGCAGTLDGLPVGSGQQWSSGDEEQV